MTAIEWADETWNPVTGCSKVSPGCARCYAETQAAFRAGRPGWIEEHRPWTPQNAEHNVRLWPARLDKPLHWRKPRMVFVNSMSDLFHEEIPAEFIARVFAVMAAAEQHTFQVLTKRPERMRDLLNDHLFVAWVANLVQSETLLPITWPLPNVWLGTSIENRRFVDRADLLRETPAAVRFISAEPLLGPLVGMEKKQQDYPIRAGRPHGVVQETWRPGLDLTGIDWLIVGGESGPRHRPIREEWVRDLRDLATDYGTAFFMKQMGGHRAGTALEDLPEDLRIREWPETGRTAHLRSTRRSTL